MKVKVSRYMSYLLRHNPGNLKIDRHGFIDMDGFLVKLRERFPTSKKLVIEIVENNGRKRFEIVGNKIRALYGHTIPVELELEEDKTIKVLYHGTTPEAVSKILKEGLKPMKRKWVHLSPTIAIATEVGLRRTNNPVLLEINTEASRKNGLRFYRTTDKVYVCGAILSEYIRRFSDSKKSREST